MNTQEQNDTWAADMYQNRVHNNELVIDRSNVVQNIQFVDLLPVKQLTVSNSYGICFDRSPSKITCLQICSCQQLNFQGFEQMNQLTKLSLYYNNLSQIEFISSLTQLTQLNLSSNLIKNLNPLKDLIELKKLDLIFNQIQDLSPLRKLVKLQVLQLSENQIVDIYPLKNLKQLTQLYMRTNLIIDVSPIKYLAKLNICDFNFNLILDLTPLSNYKSRLEEAEEIIEETSSYMDEYDESEEDTQSIPSKQLLQQANLICIIYKLQEDLQQIYKKQKIAELSIDRYTNYISPLISQQVKQHVSWSQKVAFLFEDLSDKASLQ
ncbi:leucine-rich_repeat domain-containing protein [Hexamita inflata]|uniref:Leucine-rich_repeat domain-containing protein n=1 Tax=Hexamita inflata TaxID=28002 RepID=A0ABP1GHM7_9EUKA